MKRFLLISCAVLFVFVLKGVAHTAPIYYTFSGTVSSMYDPDSLFANAGLDVGSAVSYTFMFDLAGNATYTRLNEEVYTYDDYTASYPGGSTVTTYDYFEADYLDGSALTYAYTGSEPETWITEYNYGLNYKHDNWWHLTGSAYGMMTGNSQGDRVDIKMSTENYYDLESVFVQNWVVGDAVEGSHLIVGSTGTMEMDLTLTAISDTAPDPIPEPATMLLLGSGLIGLAGFRRKNKRS